jgi:UDP-sugar transporter A1/2/3
LAYENLDALTFNVLNQTKTLSAALCCYLVMGRQQSRSQVVALFLLLLSALVMERIVTFDWFLGQQQMDVVWEPRHIFHGVIPILVASFISGLAGALSQKNLQTQGRSPFFFTMELSAASFWILSLSLLASPDGQRIAQHGFYEDWNVSTIIPILTNAAGGIVVGLVTKYAGSVQKGFALIFGIFISGVVQKKVSKEQWIGGTLAALSLWMHAVNPPVIGRIKEDKDGVSRDSLPNHTYSPPT